MTLKDELPKSVGVQYATGEEWRSHFSKKEEMETKQKNKKQSPVMDEIGDGSKVRCCKKQYCIGAGNVRSMNQGKVKSSFMNQGKQEMARVNIDILGISELKQTGMGEFNSDDHYIYCCGQESL